MSPTDELRIHSVRRLIYPAALVVKQKSYSDAIAALREAVA